MDFRIEAACGSSIGAVRSNNEDNFLFDGRYMPPDNLGQKPPLTLSGVFPGALRMGIFDGMGGAAHGELASFTAAACCAAHACGADPLQELEQLCLEANKAVWNAHDRVGTHNMGTTLALLELHDAHIYTANVGDSRIFGLRDGQLLQISRDHTDEAFLKARGITDRRPRLTQYLGMDPGQVRLEPHIAQGALAPGDVYLICSDGLTDMLTHEELAKYLTLPAPEAVDTLIRAATEKGGYDNITVIVCRIFEQTESRRETNDTDKSTLGRLGDLGLSWGRKLWQGLQDTTKLFRDP